MQNVKENRIALIPARLDSSRLPKKLLLPINEKEIIVHTYENVLRSNLFNRVVVVTDSDEIANICKENLCDYKLIKSLHNSGTDRIAEYAQEVVEDIIVNIQGDEPFVTRNALSNIVQMFDNEHFKICSLMTKMDNEEDVLNPNNVKVVCNAEGKALYFSRSPIPYYRDINENKIYYKHIGVYAYRKKTLLQIAKLKPSTLEKIEFLENLRFLEHGFEIFLSEISGHWISIDTQADYETAKVFYKKNLS